VAAGVFALGFLLFTVLLKVAVPILLGEARLTVEAPAGASPGALAMSRQRVAASPARAQAADR
jgi:hypothetical protein